jgi:hypothetical protein
METGKYYETGFSNGDVIYLLVGAALKNKGHKAISIETGHPQAKHTTTTYLSKPQWREVAESAIPPRLLAKIQAKANA